VKSGDPVKLRHVAGPTLIVDDIGKGFVQVVWFDMEWRLCRGTLSVERLEPAQSSTELTDLEVSTLAFIVDAVSDALDDGVQPVRDLHITDDNVRNAHSAIGKLMARTAVGS
jgi:hypothetical protein